MEVTYLCLPPPRQHGGILAWTKQFEIKPGVVEVTVAVGRNLNVLKNSYNRMYL